MPDNQLQHIDSTTHRRGVLLARVCAMALLGIAITTMPSPNVSAFCIVPYNRNSLIPRSITISSRSNSITRKFVYATSNKMSDSDTIDTTLVVDKLLEQVETKEGGEEGPDEGAIRDLITNLSSNADTYTLEDDSTSSSTLFEPLLGYYNVSYTLTSKPNDNPVGGKWTRGLFTVKRTMQHVLPPLPVRSPADEADTQESESIAAKSVAQVINAIRLELLWGFVSIYVLLRGDAVPLKLDQQVSIDSKNSDNDIIDGNDSKKKKSPPKLLPNLSDRTVKAYFDRPRIGVRLHGRKKRNKNGGEKSVLLQRVLTLGPTSAVVLDTPYADNRVRLGKGGTSGSQFVFRRVLENDEEAREGWKWVLEDNKSVVLSMLTKKKLTLRVGVLVIAFSLLSRFLQQGWMKVGAGVSAVLSGISMLGIMRSTGGIETEGDTYMKGKQ